MKRPGAPLLPKSPSQDSKPGFGESATQFARGFAHGVGAESLQLYNDTKALPPSSPKREQNSPKISSPVVSYEHSHHCAPHLTPSATLRGRMPSASPTPS